MNKFSKLMKNLFTDKRFIIVLIALVVLVIAGIVIYNMRYSPTEETMSLNDYYEVEEGGMAVIVDGALAPKEEGAAKGIVRDNTPYVKISFLNDVLNDRYAYDSQDHNVCYSTKEGTYKANTTSKGYTFKGQNKSVNYIPVIEDNGTAYIALEFVKDTNGAEYTFNQDPARAAIYTPGRERVTAVARKDAPMRRFGGNRSKIVGNVKEDDKVTVVENYGSWSQILTSDGILGCVENSTLTDKENEKNKTTVAQESMKHNQMNTTVRLGWHQLFSKASNGEVQGLIAAAPGLNVISPTWIQIKDNKGGINDLSSAEYVIFCHSNNIKVWTLVSNIEHDVNESLVFNTAASRETLINNIINSVTAVGSDGINIDMESVGDANVGGYIEFIKELALECQQRGLVLSIDNYNIKSADYDVDIQARYADYIVLFGYDETWTGAGKAGSNNSMKFVKEGVEGMLNSGVDNKQLILGIPFYTRLWAQKGDSVTSETVTLKGTPALLSSNNAQVSWLNDNKENYATWQNGDTTYSIWIVDDKSLKERCSYVADKKIAGVAAWKLGNETTDIWQMIKETVK